MWICTGFISTHPRACSQQLCNLHTFAKYVNSYAHLQHVLLHCNLCVAAYFWASKGVTAWRMCERSAETEKWLPSNYEQCCTYHVQCLFGWSKQVLCCWKLWYQSHQCKSLTLMQRWHSSHLSRDKFEYNLYCELSSFMFLIYVILIDVHATDYGHCCKMCAGMEALMPPLTMSRGSCLARRSLTSTPLRSHSQPSMLELPSAWTSTMRWTIAVSWLPTQKYTRLEAHNTQQTCIRHKDSKTFCCDPYYGYPTFNCECAFQHQAKHLQYSCHEVYIRQTMWLCLTGALWWLYCTAATWEGCMHKILEVLDALSLCACQFSMVPMRATQYVTWYCTVIILNTNNWASCRFDTW